MIDLVGQQFGRLTVLERAGISKEKRATWWCRCECGRKVEIVGKFLRDGRTQSCGCYNKDIITKHGHNTRSGMSPEYATWHTMKKRCYEPNQRGYENYGGRGIKVCDRWLDSFEAFLFDMGPKPSEQHSIERKDNNGDYCPGNCYWATNEEQSNNKRVNRYITIDGQTKTMGQWCKHFGINKNTASNRINQLNWDPGRAVSTPPIKL